MKNYNSKVCKNYLILHNQPMPDKSKDKRTAVFSHHKQMKAKKEKLQHIKLQPCIIAGHRLVSNAMTASYHNVENLKTNIKIYLNEITALDNLCNAIKIRYMKLYDRHLNIII